MRIYTKRQSDDWLGISLSTVAGLGLGVIAGIIGGDLLGRMSPDRVQRAMRRLRRGRRVGDDDPQAVERAVQDALGEDAATRDLQVSARALGDGIVELTGTAPNAAGRQLAGTVAKAVPGADVVVNRILVEGDELPHRHPTSSSGG